MDWITEALANNFYFFYFIINRIMNKQDLILKINKILNKLNKDKLIKFYDIYINKKGGSLRPLCYHLNNEKFNKSVEKKKAHMSDDKLYYPTKYEPVKLQLKDLSKDIYLLHSVLIPQMVDKYDDLKEKNADLKYQFVCYTQILEPIIAYKGIHPLDIIKDFIEVYLQKKSPKYKFTIRKLDNSNKIRININSINIDIIYTSDYNRINILMYLEEISEKRRKQIFDEFPECYLPTSTQIYPVITTAPAPAQTVRFDTQFKQIPTFGQTTTAFNFGNIPTKPVAGQISLFPSSNEEKEINTEFEKLEKNINSALKSSLYSVEFTELYKQMDILFAQYLEIEKLKRNFKTDDEIPENIKKLINKFTELYNKFVEYNYNKFKNELDKIIEKNRDKQESLKDLSRLSGLFRDYRNYDTLFYDNIKILYDDVYKYKTDYEQYLNDTTKIKLTKDYILIALIAYYYNKKSYLKVEFDRYISLFDFINNNFKLYKSYQDLEKIYNELKKIKYTAAPLITIRLSREERLDYDRIKNNYDELCNKMIKIIERMIQELKKSMYDINILDIDANKMDIDTLKSTIKKELDHMYEHQSNKYTNLKEAILAIYRLYDMFAVVFMGGKKIKKINF